VRDRNNFSGGAWVSLSVGRSKQAEPRWLIPMLCKAGGLTKRQLGTIRIHDHETHVEIDAESVDAFMARVGGEGGKLEKHIHVTRIEAPSAQRVPRPRNTAPNQRLNKPPQRVPHGKAERARADAKRPNTKHTGPPPCKKKKWRPAD
jgi:ATP-dependent RNA helicase DeaD